MRFLALRCSVLAACLLLCSATASAEIRTFVDPRVIDETETLRLTLRLDGSRSAEAPDLKPLEKDFEVLGSNSSSQYRSRNGRVQAWIEYQISLRPRRTGALTIPALDFAGGKTEAVQVEVQALDPALRAEIDRLVFFETALSAAEVYVQAELVYERRLYYAASGGVQMYSDLPGTPTVDDAVVLPLGEPLSTAETRNGIRYGVVTQRYALYPEKPGRLTIPGASLTSSVRVQKNGRARRSGVRVQAESESVQVRPIPATYPADAPWLPARSVNLTQRIEPENGWQTGDTVQRIVRAEVTGNVGSAIPPLLTDTAAEALRAAGLRLYPEPASTRDQVLGASNLGAREERAGLVALRPGAIALPQPVLVWWNTEHERVERTLATPLTVSIGGQPIESATATPAQSAEDNRAESEATSDRQLSRPAEPLLSATVIALLCLALGAGVWLSRTRDRWSRVLKSRLANALGPLTARWTERPRSPARLSRALDTALEVKPRNEWRHILIECSAQLLDRSAMDAVRALRVLPEARPVLDQLSAQDFSRTASEDQTQGLSAEQVQRAFAALRAAHARRRAPAPFTARVEQSEPLPPLYPRRKRRSAV